MRNGLLKRLLFALGYLYACFPGMIVGQSIASFGDTFFFFTRITCWPTFKILTTRCTESSMISR